MIAKIGNTEVPYVYALNVTRETVGERQRTAGGKLRQDVVAVKRTWRLQTRVMTKSEATSILSEVASGAAVDFKLDELGSSVKAYVDIQQERVPSNRGGTWQTDSRVLTLTVTER